MENRLWLVEMQNRLGNSNGHDAASFAA